MDCAQFEILLADAIDGTLAADVREDFDRHRATCAICASLAEDAGAAVAFMERAAEVIPPPVLVTKILHATNSGWELALRGKGLRGWINRAFAPVLQPRFVLGAAMTIMSATMLTECAGLPKKNLTAQDLDPVRIVAALELRAERVWDRALKSYESMRLVYEVKDQLNEWSERQKEADEAEADSRADQRKLDPAPASHEGAGH